MSGRSAFWVVSGAIGCSLLLLCVCVATLLIAPEAAPLLNSASQARVDRIVYIDNDQNVQVVDPLGERRVALTTDATATSPRAYIFPTWSPDSQRVAFIGVTSGRTLNEGGLYTMSATGGDRTTIFESQTNIPFYAYWSPDSQRIGFLAQINNQLTLMLGHTDGKTVAQQLETGSPFYWSWSPDSQSILLHTGGSRRTSRNARLALLRWQESKLQVLSRAPSEFEAPHYSPDGKSILYAGVTDSTDDALYLADAQDTNARVIANYRGQIAFAWSPDSKKIAWLPTAEDSRLINEGPIFMSDADGKNVRKIVDEDTLAFYWSPDGKQIAYLVLVQGENQGCLFDCERIPGLAAPLTQSTTLRLRWRLVNVDDAKVRTLVTFVPTATFIAILPYFDQYARSMTFWSPDSQRFVYTQSEGEDIGSVWVASVAGNDTPRRIGDGVLAVWSWR